VRASIVKNIKETLDTQAAIPDLATKALKGGHTVGNEMVIGIVKGLESGQGLLNGAATRVVNAAIEAMRVAAKVKSPSKLTHILGAELIQGLADGISDTEQKAIDAARSALEKTISGIEGELDKVKGRAKSFSDTIRGAFSGFLDLGSAVEATGGNVGAAIAINLGGASQLADVLEALKRQGASKALLANVAQSGTGFGQALLAGGPAQIAEANQALKTIAELAQQTGKGLSEAFFGDKIDKVERKLDRLHDDLRELAELERNGHNHPIVMDGEKVANAVERNIDRNLDRRGSAFGGALRK
jgi:hypothetical protein